MVAKRTFAFPTLLIVGVSLLIGLAIYFLFGDVISAAIKERLNRIPFDAAGWQAGSRAQSGQPVRIRMVDDLLRRHTFTGLSRTEAVKLLGEPDKTEHFKGWDMVYWLGPERGWLSVDSEWLLLKLDSAQKVSDCRLARD